MNWREVGWVFLIGITFIAIVIVPIGLILFVCFGDRIKILKKIVDIFDADLPKIRFRNRKRVPLWRCVDYDGKDGKQYWIWVNKIPREERKLEPPSPKESQYSQIVYQYEIDEAEEERKLRKDEEEKLHKAKKKQSILYFSVSHYPRAVIKLEVPELYDNPDSDPEVPVWVKANRNYFDIVDETQKLLGERYWYNLRGEYNIKQIAEKHNLIKYYSSVEDGPIPENHGDIYRAVYEETNPKTVRLSEIIYPKVDRYDLIIGDELHKYSGTGRKIPSDIWTIMPSMTLPMIVFGFIALFGEHGPAFCLFLFLFWCYGMYKNAEYKNFWKEEKDRETNQKIREFSREQKNRNK